MTSACANTKYTFMNLSKQTSSKSRQTTFQTSCSIYFLPPTTQNLPPPPLQPAGRQKIRGMTSSCQGKPAGVCSSGLTDSTPRPHFFDLPGTASQLTGTTDGPGVGKQARQLSETADSIGALQNSWGKEAYMIELGD